MSQGPVTSAASTEQAQNPRPKGKASHATSSSACRDENLTCPFTGILKKPSFQSPSPALGATSTSPSIPSTIDDSAAVDGDAPRRPSLPHTASEKEVVAANTRANAGLRRNSSTPRSRPASRRQSSAMDVDGNHTSVQFDEAQIFRDDQHRGSRMTIDEPKTPFVHGTGSPDYFDDADHDLTPDALNGQDVIVDELDKRINKNNGARTNGIPDLDLGESEATAMSRSNSSDKRVVVGENGVEESATGHGEKSEEDMTGAERSKHKRFEEMRKSHYKIPNGLLVHPEDEMDDE